MAPRIVVVGSVNLDLVVQVERLPQPGETVGGGTFTRVPGGKGANQAVACSRLGADVTMIAAVGRDPIADEALAGLREAGVALQGWELKAIRAGRLGIGESYALVKNGEIFLFGAQITPLISASTHVVADDRRTRKLLLHRHEIDRLVGRVEREGYTLVPTAMYWRGNKVKLELALAKGKKTHDKRATEKERDWQREKQRTMRAHNRNA